MDGTAISFQRCHTGLLWCFGFLLVYIRGMHPRRRSEADSLTGKGNCLSSTIGLSDHCICLLFTTSSLIYTLYEVVAAQL
ncbi:hypothetical protein HOY80DRAFT_139903 [Tuber brumale]|nr:hypothetical protein HOY80DRAFT_139903 [Tuber brumale]